MTAPTRLLAGTSAQLGTGGRVVDSVPAAPVSRPGASEIADPAVRAAARTGRPPAVLRRRRARAIELADRLVDSPRPLDIGGRALVAWCLSHPWRLSRLALRRAQLLLATARLPRLTVELGADPSVAAMLAALDRQPGLRFRRHLGRSVYFIPESGRPFCGRRGHGSRSYINQARARGLFTVTLDRLDLPSGVVVTDFARCAVPCCGGRSYAACRPDGRAIALTHVHISGQIAQLDMAAHTPGEELSGQARYAVFQHLVRDLAEQGVEALLLLDDYFATSPGLRQFQRVLGYFPVNLRLRGDRAASRLA